jgi:tmRNA-binding protein
VVPTVACVSPTAGVQHLYVHVVADNTPAHNLYLSLGYVQEAEETEAFAHSLRRPRRLLLHKQL